MVAVNVQACAFCAEPTLGTDLDGSGEIVRVCSACVRFGGRHGMRSLHERALDRDTWLVLAEASRLRFAIACEKARRGDRLAIEKVLK